MWIGATSMLVKKNDGSYAKIQDEKLNDAEGQSLYKMQDGYTGASSGTGTIAFYYWACGPKALQSDTTEGIKDVDFWNGDEPNHYSVSNVYDRTNQIGTDTTQYENCDITDLRSTEPKLNDYPEGAWGSSYVPLYIVQFGGYEESTDPGGRQENKVASDMAIVGNLDAYYTYIALDATGNEINRYSPSAVSYKLGLTDVYKAKIIANNGAGEAYVKWNPGVPLLNPAPEGGNSGLYTYDERQLPVVSTQNMFAEDQNTSGFATASKLDLSEYTLPQLTTSTDMFKGVGQATDGFPAIGLASEEMAVKFNDAETGIDKTKIYFGNVIKVEGQTQAGYRYGSEAISIDLVTAGVESYTITGTGNTKVMTEADFTSEPYTFDLTNVFNDEDKAKAKATSLRTTVTIVKVMAQQYMIHITHTQVMMIMVTRLHSRINTRKPLKLVQIM